MNPDNLRHPSAILKVIEIVMLIIIMALYFSQGPLGSWTQYVSSVFIGCFINAIILLTLIFMGYDQIQKTPLELLLYSYYIVATLVSAILLFTVNNGPWIAGGVFCLLLLIIYGCEVYLAFSMLVGRSYPPGENPAAPPQMQSSEPHQTFPTEVYPPPPTYSTTPHQTFPTEAYPPPPTYPNTPQMQNVDLGNPFDEHLEQL